MEQYALQASRPPFDPNWRLSRKVLDGAITLPQNKQDINHGIPFNKPHV